MKNNFTKRLNGIMKALPACGDKDCHCYKEAINQIKQLVAEVVKEAKPSKEPTPCIVCEGEGVAYNPLWKEWYDNHDKKYKHLMGVNSDNFGNDDYDRELFKYFNVSRSEDFPKEEYECNNCEGEGKVSNSYGFNKALDLFEERIKGEIK